MAVHIPHFDEKFQHLFGADANLRSYAALARAVNVTGPLIAGWKNGTAYSRPEHIPTRHIAAVCDALNVSQELLEASDLAHFIARMRERPRPNLWDQVAAEGDSSGKLWIIRKDEVVADPTLLGVQRGIYVPSEPMEGIPVFSASAEFVVRLDAPSGWHVLLLLKDRSGWQCLHPTARFPQTLCGAVFLLPHQDGSHASRFARFDRVLGPQRLVAVITRDMLAETLLAALVEESDLPRTLLQLADTLRQPGMTDGKAEILQFRYQVDA